MAADNQFQLSVIQPTQPAPLTKTARQVVPQFLQKLYEYVVLVRVEAFEAPSACMRTDTFAPRMVSNTSTNHLIKWSDAGDSFIGEHLLT